MSAFSEPPAANKPAPPAAAESTPTGRPSRAAINAAINVHFANQRGLISQAQLRDAGLSTKSIRTRVKAGELHSRIDPAPRPDKPRKSRRQPALPARGVFSSAPGPLSIDALRWRAVLAGPDGSGLGSISGCVMHDLDRQRGTNLHIVYPGTGWRPSSGIVAHGIPQLTAREMTKVRGLPCTTVGRSIFDAARDVDEDTLDDLLDRAVELRVYDERELKRLMRRFKNNADGVTELGKAIGRLDDKSGEFRSRFERKTTRLVQTSTLIPSPVVNVLVEGFRPDLHWLYTRAIVECDGADYHRSLDQVLADEAREEILLSLGYRILRLRWSQVRYEQERTLERIERFVLANGEAPVPGR